MRVISSEHNALLVRVIRTRQATLHARGFGVKTRGCTEHASARCATMYRIVALAHAKHSVTNSHALCNANGCACSTTRYN